ncbi:MAG: phosphoribosylanthranilate isomerase [Gammaproteobacteria bacterium]|nr:phosphoribosylanthranilate isomerase [Gammaproteobacteria bacterium]
MPSRTRVKFCGMRTLADAALAVDLGVDALGFVFYRDSPRNIDVATARAIIATLPPLVTSVGLFVDAERSWVERVVAETGIDLIQFHGKEPGQLCSASPRPYIKAIQVDAATDFAATQAEYAGARALLLDAHHPQIRGGTGLSFDWSLIPSTCRGSMILAGGLSCANVADAIRTVRPYAVDVSGGIESRKGVKDAQKMRDFIAEVRKIERELESKKT